MKIHAARLVAATTTSILSSVSLLSVPATAEPARAAAEPAAVADRCLTSPREYTPPGTRWRYHIERGTGRRCWFLKDDSEKTAAKTAAPPAKATEEPAPAPSRRKSTAQHSVSDARAEFSQAPVDSSDPPARVVPAPASSAPAVESNSSSSARSASLPARPAVAPWPDPVSTVNAAATQSASPAPATPYPAPADQTVAETRSPAVTPPPARPPVMPRVVPPMPASEKPMSLPMLITVVVGGLSVFAVLVSMLLAWRTSRANRLTPSAPMPPLELPDTQRRPGDLYRARQRQRARKTGRRAA